jgi:hypothetical protein
MSWYQCDDAVEDTPLFGLCMATYSPLIFVSTSQQKFQLRLLDGSVYTRRFASSRQSELGRLVNIARARRRVDQILLEWIIAREASQLGKKAMRVDIVRPCQCILGSSPKIVDYCQDPIAAHMQKSLVLKHLAYQSARILAQYVASHRRC